MMIRHVAPVLAGAVVLSALVGCAVAAPSPTPAPTVSTTPVPTPSATVEPGARPISSFELDCDQLLSPAAVEQIAGAEALPREPDLVPGFLLERASVIQDGGLICEWATPDSPLHAPNIQIAALAGTDRDLDRIRPMLEAAPHNYQVAIEGSSTYLVGCREDFSTPGIADCIWMAERDGVWMEAYIPGVATPEGALSGTTVSTAVRTAFDVLVASAATTPTRIPPRSCSEILLEDRRDTPIGELSVEQIDRRLDTEQGITAAPWMTIGLWLLAQERLGWTTCDVNLNAENRPGYPDLARITDARGLAWIYGESERTPLGALLETVTSCGVGEGGGYCYISVLRGDDVIMYRSDDPQTGIAEGILSGLSD